MAFESVDPRFDNGDLNQESDVWFGTPEGPLRVLQPEAASSASPRLHARLPREGGPPGSVTRPVSSGLFSPDGTRVLLCVEGPTVQAASNTWQLIVKDLTGPGWTLVSRGTSGGGSRGWPFLDAQFVPDGSAVVYTSRADDLVAPDGNNFSDVFEFHLASVQTRVLSRTSTGAQALGGHSFRARVTPDGRSVVLASFATNLTATSAAPGLRLVRVPREAGTNSLLLFQAGNTSQSTSASLFRRDPMEGFRVFVDFGLDGTATAHLNVWEVGLLSGAALKLDGEITGPQGAVSSLRSSAPTASRDGNRAVHEILHGPTAGTRVTSLVLWDRLRTGPAQVISLDHSGSIIAAGAVAPRLSPDGSRLLK